jgi:hypothetical protein
MLDEVGLGFNEPSPGVGGLGGLGDFGGGATTSDVARGLLSDLSMGGGLERYIRYLFLLSRSPSSSYSRGSAGVAPQMQRSSAAGAQRA